MTDGERLALRQDMTMSRDAFLRNLPAAVAHAPFQIRGDEIAHDGPERGWRIRLVPLPDRTLGALRLERHALEIHLRGYDAAAEREFLERFELHFRRGGG